MKLIFFLLAIDLLCIYIRKLFMKNKISILIADIFVFLLSAFITVYVYLITMSLFILLLAIILLCLYIRSRYIKNKISILIVDIFIFLLSVFITFYVYPNDRGLSLYQVFVKPDYPEGYYYIFCLLVALISAVLAIRDDIKKLYSDKKR